MKLLYQILIATLFVLSLFICPTAEEEMTYEFGHCEVCHTEIADNLRTSLHYTGRGMMSEYNKGAANEFGFDMTELYADKNCAKCHVTHCSDCHGLEPHIEDLSQNIETCDKCHLKKQSTFVGDMPAHKSKGPSADIHYEKGFVCVDCHTANEAHGDGTEYTNMLTAVKVTCEDCHNNPSESVNGLVAIQYSTEIEAHMIHDETLDCSACHVAWMPTCVNCHIPEMKIEGIVIDKFHLLEAPDGKVKPFLEMVAVYDGEKHTAYAEYFSHTVTDEPHDCEFCHEDLDVLCYGYEGQMIGPPGASFISTERIDEIYGVTSIPTETVFTTPGQSGFEIVFAIVGLLVVAYLVKKH